MLDALKTWLADRYEQAQQWFYDFVLWIPRKLWSEFLEQMAEIVESLGVPDFLNDAIILFASWGPDAAFWFDLLQFNWGISSVMTAFSMRYAWSKIPFIGR